MEIVTSTSAIVPEVLKKDNYVRWSTLMEHYLVAQDLWDVVKSNERPGGGNEREWMKKNAFALHAIGISCGREAFYQIKNKRSAKDAWDALAAKLKPPPIVPPIVRDVTHEYQDTLRKYIYDEPISSVKQFFLEKSDAKSPQLLLYALQLAITHDRKNMARYLYKEIPLEFLEEDDRGFFLLEECITKKMFDIAFDLLYNSPKLAFQHPQNSIPIILILAQTPLRLLSDSGFLGQWIYKSTRVKVFPIKPRSAPPAAGVGIVPDKLREWIFPVLYKYHLACVIIGLLCWMPCWLPVRMEGSGVLVELLLLFIVPLLKLDPLCVLIGVPLLTLVPSGNSQESNLFWTLLAVFILLLVILRLILSKLEKELSRKQEPPRMLRIAAELLRAPIGVPLLLLGVPISLSVSNRDLIHLRVIFFPLFLLFSMPLLIFVNQKYKLKLMDEYALEVIRSICGSLSKLDENQFEQSRAMDAIYRAIENDIPEIVVELFKKLNGNISWINTDPEDSRNMFAHAVAHRQDKVARFLYDEFGKWNNTNMVTAIDEDGNNILHVAAQLAPHSQLDRISGAALQLQSELHWFKSVEGIVPRFYNMKNNDGETPIEIFHKEHKNLLKEAEEWMKKVAESCTIVGALVITVMFAAAFTVPGGNNQDTGFPIILNETMTPSSPPVPFAGVFRVFAVSDAISLFAASSSVLMFLGILTSRYACQDFYISLPHKLIIGLSSLFISIAAMMVAFCATLFIMLHGMEEIRILISLTLIACIPVAWFLLLQSPLFIEIYGSTFRPDIFNRRRYRKYVKNVYSCFNRRWWFRTRRGWIVVMLCALVLLYLISFVLHFITLSQKSLD